MIFLWPALVEYNLFTEDCVTYYCMKVSPDFLCYFDYSTITSMEMFEDEIFYRTRVMVLFARQVCCKQ